LRAPADRRIFVDGRNVTPDVHEVLGRMAAFSDRVRNGEWKGYTGKRIKNVINIGIGGSDLGPKLAYQALKRYSRDDMVFRFISNVDGTDFAETTTRSEPRGNPFYHFIQDVHHAGNHDERAHRPPMGAAVPGR
jgi:glucose-6-phosphate isomerase